MADSDFLSFPPAAFGAGEASGQTINTTRIDEQHHVEARQLNYLDGKVTRFPVPEENVPWEVFSQPQ